VDSNINKQKNEFLGSGWSFPVTFSAGNHQLSVSKYEANVNESIHLILMTHLGERCMNFEFGSGLQQYMFKKMNETLKGEIMDTVYFSLLNNEPRIDVQKVGVEFPEATIGFVEITVDYLFSLTNTRHNYVFPFYLGEGTNLKSI